MKINNHSLTIAQNYFITLNGTVQSGLLSIQSIKIKKHCNKKIDLLNITEYKTKKT